MIMNVEQYEYLNANSIGICQACGEEQSDVEPDARNYECEACGAEAVFGAEEALLMGLIEIEEE